MMAAAKHFPKGLDHRQRDKDGEIRQKRGDTQVKTLRKEYGDQGGISDQLREAEAQASSQRSRQPLQPHVDRRLAELMEHCSRSGVAAHLAATGMSLELDEFVGPSRPA